MPIPERFRGYMEELRMLSRDAEGREVLVGLTFEDSEWYLAYSDAGVSEDGRSERRAGKSPEEIEAETARYLALHDRHEMARLQIVGAEMEARRTPERH